MEKLIKYLKPGEEESLLERFSKMNIANGDYTCMVSSAIKDGFIQLCISHETKRAVFNTFIRGNANTTVVNVGGMLLAAIVKTDNSGIELYNLCAYSELKLAFERLTDFSFHPVLLNSTSLKDISCDTTS